MKGVENGGVSNGQGEMSLPLEPRRSSDMNDEELEKGTAELMV